MIYANGIKKSGTHLLQKYLKLQGIEAVVHHAPYREIEADGEHHFIVRDPRNVLVSWLRWKGRPVNERTLMEGMYLFEDGFTLPAYCSRFVPWLTDERTKLYRFELISADESIHGGTPTWSYHLSDWRLVWTPDVSAEWKASRCYDLQLALGYPL